ncbi:FAD-dependent oxidoreductase [Luteolibacter marinus]|uniref:FAD-dependent oxidoreductase n=1 Tax=Luteolibacter marinus TaxID=2776705 RepID=UPI0018676EF0|nr:FAD-dependent oxidoreductase [Luteolibacter marinus]
MSRDVIVLGAGSAGLAAAVTAAREGAQVTLLERHGYAGGMGTASLVHTFCGLYRMGEGPPVMANPGFPAEMAGRMLASTGDGGPVKMGRVWVLRQHPVDFVRIADELLRESGIEVIYHAEAFKAGREGGLWAVDYACRGQIRRLEGKTVVDASGDAVLAGLLDGASYQAEPAKLQRPAYVFGVQGVIEGEQGLALAGRIVDGIRRGVLSQAALGLHFRASGRAGELFGTIDLSGAEEGDYDPLDGACLSRLEEVGRSVAGAAVDFLKGEAGGWGGAYISHWPVRAGVRESRRWQGRYRLTGDEVLGGVRHADDIALAAWPLEFRETNRGPKLRYPDGDRAAGIPLGCLQPVAPEGIFTAGRCISCDHDAQASVRVMGTCFATGQAAGLAAVLAARGEPVEGLPARLEARFGPLE